MLVRCVGMRCWWDVRRCYASGVMVGWVEMQCCRVGEMCGDVLQWGRGGRGPQRLQLVLRS